MLVKSRVLGNHVDDLEETFTILRRYQMKLNRAKCVFEMTSGKFLGFIVSYQRIEANPEDTIHKIDGSTEDNEGGAKAHRKNRCPQLVHL